MNNYTQDITPDSKLSLREVVFGIILASASGAAVLAHAFVSAPMTFTVPFIVLPTFALLLGVVLLRRKLYHRFHIFAEQLILGAWTGLVATLAYDAIRPVLQLIFQFSFEPYKAIPIFGQLITGLPATDNLAIITGWIYHFWNGVSFGMMFALLKPKGGAVAGLIWGLGLQCLMMAAYPKFLQIRLEDPGFLVTGLVGHSLWGIVLGLSVKRWSKYD